jgi:hypothetical protein
MGRSYWFECPRCSYRARVAGRADRGISLFVQTILCRDCKELYDAVTRLRIADEPGARGNIPSLAGANTGKVRRASNTPPSFQAAMNRLSHLGLRRSRWVEFEPRCPVSNFHRVQAWNEPNKCPRCGAYLEKSVLPYRIWD